MKKYIQPDWPAPAHIKAYTTLREGWSGQQKDRVNLPALLHLPEDPIWLKQIHSTRVVAATLENKGQEADASFTTDINRVCVSLTADCLPLLMCNPSGTQVAAIHAGWRGLANGIIENTVKALNQPTENWLAWLGPAIGPQKFEVGQDVYDAFVQQHTESVEAFKPHTPGKWLADLYLLAKIRLKFMGISQIYGGEYCTYSQSHWFYSYRRDQGKTGRMASLIWIEQN